MTEEATPEVIKKTQDLLGKYVKKPVLSEKLLKKPPFRFLHDIVTSIIRDTGFLAGLYSKEELQSENVKDKEAKIDFLQKLINTVKITTGKEISARPNKIVAGYEPIKTNELLQAIGRALQKNLSTDEAILQIKEGKVPLKESKSKDHAQKKSHTNKEKNEKKEKKEVISKRDTAERKIDEKFKRTSLIDKKHKSESSNNIQSLEQEKNSLRNKQDTNVKSIKSRDKTFLEKRKEKDSTEKKKEKKTEKYPIKTEKKEKKRTVIHKPAHIDNDLNELQDSKKSLMRQGTFTNEDKKEAETSLTQYLNPKPAEHDLKADPSLEVKTIFKTESIENSLMGELTLHDSLKNMEINDITHIPEKPKSASFRKESSENITPVLKITETESIAVSIPTSVDDTKVIKKNSSNTYLNIADELQFNNELILNIPKKKVESKDKKIDTKGTDDEKPQEMETKTVRIPSSRPRSSLRPPSVRPSSARPGAPRVKDRSEVIVPVEQIVPMGKVNVIVENFDKMQEEDDENESLVIVESTPMLQELKMEPSIFVDSEQESKGHLVAQILKTHKELTDDVKTTMPIKIEWEVESQRSHEIRKRDIEGLRAKIQTLTRAALPLGQIINFLQEDYDNIMQEFKMWHNINEKLGQEIKQQKIKAKEVLQPLKIQLEEIEKEIEKQKEQNNIAKAEILYNKHKIEKMLTTII